MRPFGHRRDSRSRAAWFVIGTFRTRQRKCPDGLAYQGGKSTGTQPCPARSLDVRSSTVLLSRCGALPWSRRISGGQESGPVQVARGSPTRHDQGKTPSSAKFFASNPVALYSAGTRSASFKGQRGEDVNVKRAVATAAGVLGALLLAAVVGLGHFAGHSSGAGTQARAAAVHAAPVQAVLTSSTSSTSTSTSSSTPSYVDDSSSYT